MELTKKELVYLVVAAGVAGIVFFLYEWRTTDHNVATGLLSLFEFIIISLIIYVIHTLSQKLIAKKSSCELEFELITTNKIPLTSIKIPHGLNFTGPLITLLISIVSVGGLLFIVLASFNPIIDRKKRIGHQWTDLKDVEEAGIAAAGPLSNISLLLIFKILLPLSNSFFSKGIIVASTLAVFHMLPFPKYDGIKIWMGSRTIYIFLLVLVVAVVIFTYLINVTATIILALILSIGISSFYFYNSNK